MRNVATTIPSNTTERRMYSQLDGILSCDECFRWCGVEDVVEVTLPQLELELPVNIPSGDEADVAEKDPLPVGSMSLAFSIGSMVFTGGFAGKFLLIAPT